MSVISTKQLIVLIGITIIIAAAVYIAFWPQPQPVPVLEEGKRTQISEELKVTTHSPLWMAPYPLPGKEFKLRPGEEISSNDFIIIRRGDEVIMSSPKYLAMISIVAGKQSEGIIIAHGETVAIGAKGITEVSVFPLNQSLPITGRPGHWVIDFDRLPIETKQTLSYFQRY